MNCSAKVVDIFLLRVRDLVEKMIGCVGGFGGGGGSGGSARLPLKDLIMLHKHDGLYLWQHDSMVWVHFYLLESAMLWPICALSSCICESVREEERGASLSTMSHLVISVRLGVMLGM